MKKQPSSIALTSKEWGVVATAATSAGVATGNPLVAGCTAIGTATGICVAKSLGWQGLENDSTKAAN